VERSPCKSSPCLKDHTPQEGPMLGQFFKSCSPWEGPTLKKFVKDCIPLQGRDPGAGEQHEEEEVAEMEWYELTCTPIPHPLRRRM